MSSGVGSVLVDCARDGDSHRNEQPHVHIGHAHHSGSHSHHENHSHHHSHHQSYGSNQQGALSAVSKVKHEGHEILHS